MPHVTYVAHDGTSRTVEIAIGTSLLDGALLHRIAGIEGDCGGACACATCHVYVDPQWFARLAPANELERQMLKFATDPQANSRLACQIKATPELDGIVVRMPASQY